MTLPQQIFDTYKNYIIEEAQSDKNTELISSTQMQ